MTGITSSGTGTGTCLRKMSFLSDADPGDSQVSKNNMAAIWCQTTPGQDGDEMARRHLPGQDAWGTPQPCGLPSSSCF